MKIKVAKSAGFCFGVKRAVDRIYALAEKNENKIYTIGKLIHNPKVLKDLNEMGVSEITEDEIDCVYKTASESNTVVIVIRTHGVTSSLYDKLNRYSGINPYFKTEDCTCPFVSRIHKIVSENSGDDTVTVIIGDAAHPEVIGTSSFASGEVKICSCIEELETSGIYNNNGRISPVNEKKILLVAQTTQKLTEWKKCQKNIEKYCTNSKIFDTICSVTEIRQTEANNLSKNVDLMLVIGGRESSNTNKLYNIAVQNLYETFLVENKDELPLDLLTPNITVGITAGASTPGSIIEEVIKQMNEKFENSNGPATMEEAESAFDGSESFADMLEDSLKTLSARETVKGIITSITPNEIHVDLKTKVTGIIPYSEVTDNPTTSLDKMYKVGDEIEAIVVKVSDLDGVATLSRKRIENILNWNKIVEAYNNGTVLTGKFSDPVKGGIIFVIDGVRVFVPASHTGLNKDADLAILTGTTAKAKIIEINEQRRRAVASVRVVAREERKNKEVEFWNTVEIDKQYDGVVKSLTAYGAFVDLGGVDGMIHSSELSWERIKHPSDVVSIGDKVTVYVKSFDPETRRIALGYKTEKTNPWVMFTENYKIGDVVSAKIVNMKPFGAFAEIVPGTDGLIHISQIADHKISKPSDVLEIGQIVEAKIVGINTENHNINLSIKALIENPENASGDVVNEDESENN